MTYEAGDARVTLVTKYDSNLPYKEWKREDEITLPHSCDDWVIGGVAEARQMISDLKALIVEMEK